MEMQGQHWDLAPYTRAALYLFATGELCSGQMHCMRGIHICQCVAVAWTCTDPLLACAAVPVTHSAGLVAHAPRAAAARAVHLLLYPFVGGRLHAIFHTLAWVCSRPHGIALSCAPPGLSNCRSEIAEWLFPPYVMQVIWGLSLLIAAPVLLSARLIPDSHVEALLGAAAVGAVFAELFMIKVRVRTAA